MMSPSFTARVVILGKTRMGRGLCIGGVIEPGGQPVRPLPRGKFCHPPGARFEIGQVWTMQLRARPDPEPPHTEDHDEWDARKTGSITRLEPYMSRVIEATIGPPEQLFGGTLTIRGSGSAFLPRGGPLPIRSVEFWRPPFPLLYDAIGEKVRFHTADRRFRIPYVGCQPPVTFIPAGSLLRVSLARWWVNPESPEEGETCSLQLSGWFGLDDEEVARTLNRASIREEDVPF